MKYLVSYATEKYQPCMERLEKSAYKFGIDKAYMYKPEFVYNSEFYEKNKIILDDPVGAGYWLWKPYVIQHTLNKINTNDYLFYCDAATEIISPLNKLFELCHDRELILFDNACLKNKQWTKRDCFVLMGHDEEKYTNGEQVAACFILLKKTSFTVNLVNEWVNFCCNPNIMTDLPNICGLDNYNEFERHKYDQSVLSLLAIKYNVELFRDPSQWGNNRKIPKFRDFFEFVPEDKYLEDNIKINSPYKTLINHHRNIKYDKKRMTPRLLLKLLKRNYSTCKNFFKY